MQVNLLSKIEFYNRIGISHRIKNTIHHKHYTFDINDCNIATDLTGLDFVLQDRFLDKDGKYKYIN
jgi:hypothetical protein